MQGEKYFLGYGVPKSYDLAHKRFLVCVAVAEAVVVWEVEPREP